MGIIKLAIGSMFGFTEQPSQIGTTKRTGGSVARDKRTARKARNAKRHKRASK